MKSINGYQFKLGLTAFARKLAEQTGTAYKIVFSGNGAATDSKGTIYLPEVKDNARLNLTQVRRWTGYILHEVGHVILTDPSVAQATTRNTINPGYAFQLWNAIEDGWIERWLPNRAPNAHAVLDPLVRATLAEGEAAGCDWNDPASWPFALALQSRTYLSPAIRPPVPAGIAAILDRAVAEIAAVDVPEYARRAVRTQENAELAVRVFEEIQQYLKSQKEEEPEGEPEEQDEGESGEGEGGEPGEAGDSGESGDSGDAGEGDSGEAGESGDSGEPGGEGGKSGDSGKPLPKTLNDVDPLAVEPQPTGGGGDTAKERNQRIKETLADIRAGTNTEERINIGFNDGLKDVNPRTDCGSRAAPRAASAKLRKEFKRLFDGSAREQWAAGKQSGAVDGGRLHRYSFDENVFRRREEKEGIDTAVVILIDVSGSTGYTGGNGTSVLDYELDAADNILGALIPAGVVASVITFDDEVTRITKFGEKQEQYRARIGNVTKGGYTADVLALQSAAHELSARREERKVVVILTDGSGDNGYEATKTAAGQLESAGITVIAIGIGGSTAVKNAYTQALEVLDLEELSTASLGQIRIAGLR